MPTKERRHCKEPQHHFRSDLGDYRGSQAKKTEVHLFCHWRSRRGQDTRWFEHRNTTYREIERALQRFASSPGVPWTIPRHWHCCVGKCLPRAFLGGSRHPRKGEALSEPVLSDSEGVRAFIQNVHDDSLRDVSPPFEHVALFDEAQRAWNLAKTADFMKRRKKRPEFGKSEPDFLISHLGCRGPSHGTGIAVSGNACSPCLLCREMPAPSFSRGFPTPKEKNTISNQPSLSHCRYQRTIESKRVATGKSTSHRKIWNCGLLSSRAVKAPRH